MSEIFDNTGLSDPADAGKSAGSNDTTGLFVSLYLIVLAFFVVMNSISNQDQNKVNAATESVTRAFKNPYEPEADFVDVSANDDAVTPNDEFYEQISGVFASLVGFEGRFPTKGGNILKITVNPADLFEDGTSIFRSDQQNFLDQLAQFLSDDDPQQKREINIVISSGKTLPKGPEYWKDINILRAGAFVRTLKKHGVAGNQLSIGIIADEKDRLTLTFFTRERAASIQSLKGHDTRKLPTRSGQEIKIPDKIQQTPTSRNGGKQ